MNNLSGSAADLELYAYGADGKLAEVGNELWSITDETGAAVDTLSDGTLYELRVSVADGGAFEPERDGKGNQNFRCTCKVRLKESCQKTTKSPPFLIDMLPL